MFFDHIHLFLDLPLPSIPTQHSVFFFFHPSSLICTAHRFLNGGFPLEVVSLPGSTLLKKLTFPHPEAINCQWYLC